MSAKAHMAPVRTPGPAPAERSHAPAAKPVADRDDERRAKKRASAAQQDDGRLQPVHAGLFVSVPDDALEREADAAAIQVLGQNTAFARTHAHAPRAALSPRPLRGIDHPLAAPRPTLSLLTVHPGRQARTAEPASVRPGGGRRGAPDFQQRLEARRGGGAPIPPPARRYFSDRFAFDFDAVRIHTDHDAASLARAAGARAFTSGRDIVFDHREYAPGTDDGLDLLAHELAHVVQQSQLPPGSLPLIQRRGVPGQPDPVSKGAADIAARAVDDPAEKSDAADNPDVESDKTAADDTADPNDKGTKPADTAPAQTDLRTDATDKAAKAAETGPAAEADREEAAAAAPEPKDLSELSSGDLALIDEELAEHQRWAGATAIVGAAGSEERATYVVASALMGGAGGFSGGLVEGAKIGGGTRLAEYAAGKAAASFAAKYAAKYGTQVAKFTPLPAVGAVIGGALSAYELIGRDWAKTGETIGRFGQGSDTYETLANSIAALSEIYDVETQVLNVIAGVIGAIAIASWAIAIATAGVASPLSVTLTAIATGIGLASLIIDAINAVVLKPLAVVFRALHAFSSDADPEDVIAQGEKIGEAAGAASGFLGGFAGGLAASKAGKPKAGKPELPAGEAKAPHPDHPNPPPAAGDGPVVKGEPPVDAPAPAAETKAAAPVEPAVEAPVPEAALPVEQPKTVETPSTPEAGALNPGAEQPMKEKTIEEWRAEKARREISFEELNDTIREMDEGSFGDKLQAGEEAARQPPPTAPPGTRWGKWQYGMLKRLLRAEEPRPPGAQAQHRTKWLASTRDLPKGKRMTPEMISQNRTWLQSRRNLPATKLLTSPKGGTRYYIGERPVDLSPQIELPGFEQPKMEPRYRTEHKFADQYLQKDARERIANAQKNVPGGIDPNLVNLWAGAEEGFVMEGSPGRGDWGWQPKPAGGTQLPLFPGEASAPRSAPAVDPRQMNLDFDRTPSNPNQLDLFAPRPAEAPTPADTLTSAADTAPMAELPPPHAAPPVEPNAPVQVQPDAPGQAASVPPEGHGSVTVPPYGKAAVAGKAGAEEGNDTWTHVKTNLGAFAHEELATPSAGQAATLAIGGPAALFARWAGRKVGQGIATARAEPVYERVNPHYPPPPGTVQDHVNVQNQLQDILEARARSETAETKAAAEEAKHKANQEPLKKGAKAAKDAITATQAHEQVLARRKAANAKADAKEKEVGVLSKEFVARSSRLAVLTVPMRTFERFTYLATYLPDSPDVLKGAKRSILKVHSDSTKFLKALENVEAVMRHQSAQQGQRAQVIDGNAASLDRTDKSADASAKSLHDAEDGTRTLDAGNAANLAVAAQMKAQASKDGTSLDAQAAQKAAQAESLAAAWRSWSQRHRQARLDALERTKANMERAGYRNIETREH